MAAGRPVIATAYSGNLAFMDSRSAFLVPYDLVPVGAGHAPYPPQASWAQPDLDAASAFMRVVFERPELADRTAQRGRQMVLEGYSPERAGAAVASRLLGSAIGDVLLNRTADSTATDPLLVS
jgi:glycosyltransferase involved in cell wall biosynthesis